MGSADGSEVTSLNLFLLILLDISCSSPEGTCDTMTRLDSEQVCCSLMLSMYVWPCSFTIELSLLCWRWISLSD